MLVLIFSLLLGGVTCQLGISHQRARWLDILRARSPSHQGTFDPAELYPAHNLSIPIDHFLNESRYELHDNGTFDLRYWFDASYYQTGGPVYLFEAGEANAEPRLPILQMGIMAKLARETGGLGVILEHRYYGTSQPFANLSTENLRFLTTAQALADTAYFAQNIIFPGMEHVNLTSYTTPWIAYGGSYSGAFVAFLRKLYPETFWAAIASSAVTEAVVDYWQYFEPIRKFGPKQCISNLQKLTEVMDNIFMTESEDMSAAERLKSAFGMENLMHDDDFMSILANAGIGYWQALNWDHSVSYPGVTDFCNTISNDTLLYPAQENKTDIVRSLIKLGGYSDEADSLTTPMLNWIGWAKMQIVDPCLSGGETLDECCGTHGPSHYENVGLDEYRAWPYQYCTEWGYFMTGSGVPEDQLPLISRLITVPYSATVCREAFNITTLPDVASINRLGGYGFSYPRLAFIDGEWDPWREASPHASKAPRRESTDSEPFFEIAAAVHHWDENGVFPNMTKDDFPPQRIREVQALEVVWAKQWLEEAKQRFTRWPEEL